MKLATYSYQLVTEAVVYDASGAKLKDAINQFNSMNEEGYKIVQGLQVYNSKKDPQLASKLDKAVSYLKNLQSVYTKMDSSIREYMNKEMKETPEIADMIKRDCERTLETIQTMRSNDKALIDNYTKQRQSLNGTNASSVISNIVNRVSAMFTIHKKESPKLQKLYSKIAS